MVFIAQHIIDFQITESTDNCHHHFCLLKILYLFTSACFRPYRFQKMNYCCLFSLWFTHQFKPPYFSYMITRRKKSNRADFARLDYYILVFYCIIYHEVNFSVSVKSFIVNMLF